MPYHSDIPPNCPPPDAVQYVGSIFRALEFPMHDPRNCQSHRERGKACDGQKSAECECECWCLSVWPTTNAVIQGRKAVPYLRRFPVGEVLVTSGDGVLRASPTNNQPLHHSFWKLIESDMHLRFNIIECE